MDINTIVYMLLYKQACKWMLLQITVAGLVEFSVRRCLFNFFRRTLNVSFPTQENVPDATVSCNELINLKRSYPPASSL